jgi:hypothetical protein
MVAYFICASVMFTFVSVMWSTDGITNVLVKMSFIGLTVWSLFLLAQSLGYVVKV